MTDNKQKTIQVGIQFYQLKKIFFTELDRLNYPTKK